MRPLTVLVTASGAPGTAALLRALRENGERELRLVGTDMSERAVGRHLCDSFHLVPAGSDPGFADAIAALCEREGVDAVLPQSSFDLQGLAEHRESFPVPVLVSSPETIRRSNDKAETYALLHRLGVPGARVPARPRRGGGGRSRRGARLPRAARLLQAGLLVGLARLPHPRPDRRPRAPAARGAARLGVHAARGGRRAAARGGRARAARDGARDRRRADDRRDRRRRARPARPPEDARGDARRARDVLRHARRRGARRRSRTRSSPSSRSSTSSTSSSSGSR